MSEEGRATNDNVTHVDFSKGRVRPRIEPPQAPVVQPAADIAAGMKPVVFRLFIVDSKVLVRIVTTTPGLILPEALKAQPVQALNFSHKFGVADFSYDDLGVRATLGFGGVNVFCDVPWAAVFGIVNHKTNEAVMWPNSMLGLHGKSGA